MIRYILALLLIINGMLDASGAYAQTAGTVALPSGTAVNTPATVSAAINTALTAKQDYSAQTVLGPGAATIGYCATFANTAGTLLASTVCSGGGGGGTPGGASGDIQINNAGSFGGVATTGSGSVVLATGPSLSGATLTTTTLAGGALSGTFTGAHTLSGAVTLSGGGTLGGTFTGAHTYSGAVTLSGGGTLGGTFTGAHTYSGLVTMSGGASIPTITNNTAFDGWTPRFIATYASNTIAPIAAGTGYAAGDLITLSDGTIVAVFSISGSAVATWGISTPVAMASVPAQPVTQVSTTGGGSGATFTLTYVPYSAANAFEVSNAFGGQSQAVFGGGAFAGRMVNPLGTNCFGPLTCGGGQSGAQGVLYGEGQLNGTGCAQGTPTGCSEVSAFGFQAAGGVTTGWWLNCFGTGSCEYESDGTQSEYFGTDSGKYALHNNQVSGYGTDIVKFVQRATNVAAFGANTLIGGTQDMTATAAANNGSGATRLTVGSTTGAASGDAVYIFGVNGTTPIRTTGTPTYITVIDGTHIDLQGSTFSGSGTTAASIHDFKASFINMTVTGASAGTAGVVRLAVDKTVGIPVTGVSVNVANVGGTTEANGTRTISAMTAACVSSCYIELSGIPFVNAWTAGGQATVLQGPTSVTALGAGALGGNVTGSLRNVVVIGTNAAVSAIGGLNLTVIGPSVAGTTLGSTGLNHDMILIGSDASADMMTATASNGVCIVGTAKCQSTSVQVGYKAGSLVATTAQRNVLIGNFVGNALTTGFAITAVGDHVGPTCATNVSVLLLGTGTSTDCTSSSNSNEIHIGTSTDMISATNTNTPVTANLMFPGRVMIGSITGALVNAQFVLTDGAGSGSNAHIAIKQTTAPTVTNGTMDANASDVSGTITLTAANPVLTFNKVMATVPHCSVSSPTGTAFTYSVVTGGINFTGGANTNTVSYTCFR